MPSAKVTSKGQITVPAEVRAALGLHEGSTVDFVPTPTGSFEIVAGGKSIQDLKGLLARPGRRPVTIEEMNDTIADAAAEAGQAR